MSIGVMPSRADGIRAFAAANPLVTNPLAIAARLGVD